jgi:lipoprotein-anchoring transpeptidase ErfK/SrfK
MQNGRDDDGGPTSKRIARKGIALALLATSVFVGLWLAAAQGLAPGMLHRSNAPVRLEADLSRRELIVRRGGDVIAAYGIAIGRPGHPTPVGDFAIRMIVWNPGWVPPPGEAWAKGKIPREPGDPANPMQGVKIYFRPPTYFIHGTNDPESIGSAASHGCIRMAPEEAADLARHLMEYSGAGQSDEWFQAVRARIIGTRYITLPVSIPLVIRN